MRLPATSTISCAAPAGARQATARPVRGLVRSALFIHTPPPPATAVVQSVALFQFFHLISAAIVHNQGENGPDVNLAQLVTAYTRQFMKTNPEEALYYLALVKYCAALPC